MPELPEVETIVRGLRGPLTGRRIVAVSALWKNSIRTSLAGLPGRRIESVSRRGKYLVFQLSDRHYLILHLKMSGSLSVEPLSTPRGKWVRTAFALDNSHELRFDDPRKFGRVYFVNKLAEITGHLGPEPLDPKFTYQQFRDLFAGRKGRLKSLLLNQEFIAGIGNIYADEACFYAGIRPLRPVAKIKEAEFKKLFKGIRAVLNHGILKKGASFDFVYQGGEFQNSFKVYGRTGEPCRKCRAPIRRTTLGARSTHYCPRCQR